MDENTSRILTNRSRRVLNGKRENLLGCERIVSLTLHCKKAPHFNQPLACFQKMQHMKGPHCLKLYPRVIRVFKLFNYSLTRVEGRVDTKKIFFNGYVIRCICTNPSYQRSCFFVYLTNYLPNSLTDHYIFLSSIIFLINYHQSMRWFLYFKFVIGTTAKRQRESYQRLPMVCPQPFASSIML